MRRAEPPVRYNDSVLTLLALADTASGQAADAVFGNLLDLLAQNKATTRGESRQLIFTALQGLTERTSQDARTRALRHVSRMPTAQNVETLQLLTVLNGGLDARWLERMRFTADAWAHILPQLDLEQIQRVCRRSDLPGEIAAQLAAIRPTPLLLPAPPMEIIDYAPEAPDDDALELHSTTSAPANDFGPLPDVAAKSLEESDASQVRNLLERIAWFRGRRAPEPAAPAPTMDVSPEEPEIRGATAESLFLLDNPLPYESGPPLLDDLPSSPTLPVTPKRSSIASLSSLLADWFWETDRSGVFSFAGRSSDEPVPFADTLAGLKGQSLLSWMSGSPQGPKVEAALRRRTSFHQVELHVRDGALEGRWLLSAVAAFDLKSGVFLGHRGIAQKRPVAPALVQEQMPDALTTLAHETRTPLNAIMGFAQLIETQPFGAVSTAYSAQADAILDASHRLLRALDDVSEGSRLDRGAVSLHAQGFSLEQVLEDMVSQLTTLAARRSVTFRWRAHFGIPHLWSDRDIVERCITRMAIAVLSTAASGETITLSVRETSDDHVILAFTRPQKLLALDDAEMMRPVQSDAQTEPRLAIGFALRLVERLSAVVGGRLKLEAGSISLILPAAPSLTATPPAAMGL